MADLGFNDPLVSAGLSEHYIGSAPLQLSRRRFLVLSGMAGFTLALAAGSSHSGESPAPVQAGAAPVGAPVDLNAYVQLREDGGIRIFAPNPEVGQGVKTSLPMIVAEELDVEWNDVLVDNAPVDSATFGSQFAGGSLSIPMRWQEMRQLGASARNMLMQAAASKWSVSIEELQTSAGQILHPATGRRAPYQEFAELAANMPVPEQSALQFKSPAEYRILGQRVTGVDNLAIVTGKGIFGSDIRLPDMLYAVYCKCPTIGGRPVKANLEHVRSLPGIVDAFMLEGTVAVTRFDPEGVSVAPGVAIVANSTWQALQARTELEVEWDLSEASQDDTERFRAASLELLDAGEGEALVEKGSALELIAASDRAVRSTYSAELVSHAQMEPQTCSAWFKGDEIEVWAPSQTPGRAVKSLAELLELPTEKVLVHQIRGGGGFGRRLDNDYVREVALIARKLGKPVKLQWTREDDMAFDCFRPPVFHRLSAALGEKGEVLAWNNHTVAVTPDGEKPGSSAGFRPGRMPEPVLDNYRAGVSLVTFKTPTGPVRAPLSNTYAFAEQSFMHELSVAAGQDHQAFLLAMLGDGRWTEEGNIRAIHTGRAANVIARVCERAGWGRSMPASSALGLSFYFSHAGHIAEVAEVAVDADRRISVKKVWVVADIGTIVNLSGAENQVQGSIVDGLSTMAGQRITVEEGVVQQTNFHQYPLLRAPSAPEIDIEFLDSGYSPTGVGEPALPPLAAAVCNGVFTATGQRIRHLPISQDGFSIA